jgi:mono/diheme cytochrome c family protein
MSTPATLMRSAQRAVRSLVLGGLTIGSMAACDWFTDFKSQPRVEPWEPLSQKDADTSHAPRGNPQFSVPISGTAVAGYQVGYAAFPGVIDSIGRVATNPTPVSEASLANGRKHYAINCAVCHGDTGLGDGPATKNGYGMPGIAINGAGTQGRSDGYIYGMIRNGRGLMPPYNRIEEPDRWDVVNYVRALQGTVQNSAGLGAVGYPGQTGASLPGATTTAPTRPAPFPRPGAPGSPAGTPITPGNPNNPGPGQAAPGVAPGDSAGRPGGTRADSLNATKRGTP